LSTELAAALTDPDLAVPVDPGVAQLAVPALVAVTSTDMPVAPAADTTTPLADTSTTVTTTTPDSVPAPPALLP
jgi:hypothetical protein